MSNSIHTRLSAAGGEKSVSDADRSSYETRTAADREHVCVWSVRALASLALFCIGIETLTRFGFAHVSRIEARIAKDHAAVLAMRRSNKSLVLLLGNSLMLESIDYGRLRTSLHGQAHAGTGLITGSALVHIGAQPGLPQDSIMGNA